LSFRNYEERMTEENVSQRAGQRLVKVVAYGLTRFALNDYLVFGLRTRRER
jgi:hypothetical protein